MSGVGGMERERYKSVMSKVRVVLSGRCVLSWFSVVIVIHLPNILSKSNNGTMTSDNSPREMGIGLCKSNFRASLLELLTRAHQAAFN